MAVFCTWTTTTNHIEVLVSAPPKYEEAIPKLLTTDENKEDICSFKYNFLPLTVDVGYEIIYKDYSIWQDGRVRTDLKKKVYYKIVDKPNFIQVDEKMPLCTWIKEENPNVEEPKSIRHYCLVGATVFVFKQEQRNPNLNQAAIKKINMSITEPRQFLRVLKEIDPVRYSVVLTELKTFNYSPYWDWDISHQRVKFQCSKLKIKG
eukprot:GHVP01043070.1.p1 GENE.GHVP01043070.1~~GHVP01043070.1.p1  ORF type:complete len:241 (-),score=25.37 GHVP01043070.1:73-687(-)